MDLERIKLGVLIIYSRAVDEERGNEDLLERQPPPFAMGRTGADLFA
jgi:hypothetical protein